MPTRSRTVRLPNKKVIQSIDVDSRGEQLAIGQERLTLMSLVTQKVTHTLDVGTGENVLWARWSPDGSKVAFTDTRQRASVYHLATKSTRDIPLEDPDIQWLDYARASDRVLIGGQRLHVWDDAKQRLIWELEPAQELLEVPLVGCLSPDGETVAVVGSERGVVLLYKVGGKRPTHRLETAPDSGRWLGFDPTMRYVACLESHAHGLFVWDLKTRKRHLPDTFNDELTVFWSVRFAPSGKQIAMGTLGGAVWVQSLKDGALLYNEKEHKRRVWDIAFTPDGSELFSGGDDHTLRYRSWS
ncbi:hypothetical protein DRW03_24355 [Corallococcus sp. H22C18031201]|nr:hypothetical protein DRW03_24355 [Corallococcus sp. H22C18031201]